MNNNQYNKLWFIYVRRRFVEGDLSWSCVEPSTRIEKIAK